MLLRRAALPLLTLTALVLGGCTGGGGDQPSSGQALLDQAKTTLDQAPSVHFVLTSAGTPTPSTGLALIGGEGEVLRPSSFQGTLRVKTLNSTADFTVISVEGTVYAQLPFQPNFSVVDPTTFGFGDPGKLLDPGTGISQLLAQAQNAELGDEKRVDGEVVREVTAQLPGDLVQRLLTSQDPSKPVRAVFSVATDSGQLRRARLTGPFFTRSADTYTVELTDYGEDVQITAPPTG